MFTEPAEHYFQLLKVLFEGPREDNYLIEVDHEALKIQITKTSGNQSLEG